MENLFVSGVLLFSGWFIVQRLRHVVVQGANRRAAACGGCASGTCGSTSPGSETELPMVRSH